MVDKINDGGPAFPLPDVYGANGCGLREGAPGMSLRDWFAGQALAGMTSIKPDLGSCRDLAELDERMSRAISVAGDIAYRYADAMLAARERGR